MSLEKPHFEVKRGKFRGLPTIEILKDGGPFWEDLPGAKNHFTFGVKKAIMILACLDTIKEFYDSGGSKPVTSEPLTLVSRKWKIDCEIERNEGFKKSGNWVDKPYLDIHRESSIRFGLLKAEAIILLANEIESFVIDSY